MHFFVSLSTKDPNYVKRCRSYQKDLALLEELDMKDEMETVRNWRRRSATLLWQREHTASLVAPPGSVSKTSGGSIP